MSTLLADYQAERAAFDTLLNSVCERRILFFRGESGSGKTTLLRSCRDRAKEGSQVLYLNIDLKGTAVTVAEILSRTSERLSEERLPNLRQVVADIERSADVDLENVRQSGFGNKISVTLQVNDPSAREQRRVAFTEALFVDLRALDQPALFIFDTYQDAITEVQDWISGPFLARLEATQQLRVVIAGQRVPDETSLDWGHCCTLRDLKGVPKPEHWLPVVKEMGLQVPGSDPLSWLNPICDLLQGRPSEIMKYLKAQQERSLQL